MLHMPFDNVTLYVEHHFSTVSGTIPFIVIDQSPVGECVPSPAEWVISRCLCVLTVDTSTLNICYQCRAVWVIPPRAMRQELTALELFHWNTFSVSEFHHFLKLSKHSHWDLLESGLVLVCELILLSLCFFFLLFSSSHGWDRVLGCSLTWSPWGRRHRTLAPIIPLSRGLANVGQLPPDPSRPLNLDLNRPLHRLPEVKIS